MVNQGLEHGNTLGTSIVLTDLLKAELSRLLPKFVNIETTEPEVAGKIPSGSGGLGLDAIDAYLAGVICIHQFFDCRNQFNYYQFFIPTWILQYLL